MHRASIINPLYAGRVPPLLRDLPGRVVTRWTPADDEDDEQGPHARRLAKMREREARSAELDRAEREAEARHCGDVRRARVQRARTLRDRGATLQEIARRMGTSTASVWRWLRGGA